MSARKYDAIVLDLDGTLLDEKSQIRPASRVALHAASAAGVHVMIATGRSTISTRPVLAELGLAAPAIVFNGAGLYCPVQERMLEERVLSPRLLERALAFGRERDLLTVLMSAEKKWSSPPRNELEQTALRGLMGLATVERADLRAEYVMRVTFFSNDHADSGLFAAEVEAALSLPHYMTHFPLNALASHRASPLSVLDVHPPCRGKGEALRVLEERHGLRPERVVVVGDATNDIPMFAGAGLSVAMGDGMEAARAAAQRVIGGKDSSAIADLVEELFLSGASAAP